jgi:hypothetical protein
MARTPRALLALLLLVSAIVLAAGCGGGDEPAGDNSANDKPAPEQGATGSSGSGNLELDSNPATFPTLAHIAPATGAFRGLKPDGREGTPPPSGTGESLQQAAQAAGCTLRLNLPSEGHHHLAPGEPHPHYKTNPPTSGAHDPVPVADGAYLETPPDVNFVHSLEHGRVEIQYSPSLPDDQQLALKGVFNADPAGMLMFPNGEMPYDVAVTAWTNLMGCDQVSNPEALAAAVVTFRNSFRGKGPERVPL